MFERGGVRGGAALFLLRDLDRALQRGRGPVHGADLHPLPGGPPGPAGHAARPPRPGPALVLSWAATARLVPTERDGTTGVVGCWIRRPPKPAPLPASMALTESPPSQPPDTGRGPWREGRALARAASLASSAALPVPTRCRRGRGPYADPYAAHSRTSRSPGGWFALVMPLVGPVGSKHRGRLAPLGGMERPRRKERFARWSIGAAAFLADLRPAPPSRPGCATPPCRCDAA
jgi:hypothetical protein